MSSKTLLHLPRPRLPVVVIGGGFAGLAAAVELAQSGLPVVVLEARRKLGGRAVSFVDAATGDEIDNGQHALMGCYHETLRFLELIGSGTNLVRQDVLRVPYVDLANGRHAVLEAGRWPSPLHMASAIARFPLLEARQRLEALWGGLKCMALRQRNDPVLAHITVQELLDLCRQSSETRAKLWHPIVIATLNELPARAAARPFVEVLARAFFSGQRDSQFVFSRVPLNRLYVHQATQHLTKLGAVVHTAAVVERILVDGDRALGVRLRDGSFVPVAGIVCAVPVDVAQRLLAPIGVSIPTVHFSPIVSVHLWFRERPPLPAFVGLLGSHTQWVFDRSSLWREPRPSAASGTYLASAVISAAHEEVHWTDEQLVTTVTEELRRAFPALADVRLHHASVVREKRATPSLTPEFERQRPGARTPIKNLVLAGDWTNTGLPATIESAVASAREAVRNVVLQLVHA